MRKAISSIVVFLSAANLFAGPMLQISPAEFDFGWCPENAKISATFYVKNIGEGIVPLTSVQPTCGCTASNFTPGELSTNEQTTIGLTFNTRGYNGLEFNKATKVKTDITDQDYSVVLKGHVLNANAKLFPSDGGTAAFEPGAKEKKKSISIENKSGVHLKLEIVQAPAAWAKIRLRDANLAPGAKANLEIKPEGSFDELRETSVTLSAKDGNQEHRVTIAIRTGAQPAVKKFQPANPVPQPNSAPPPGK